MKLLNQGGNPRPASDNNLINGKMDFNCSTMPNGDTHQCMDNAGLAKFKFTTGKTHRLRLINAGSEGNQRFSIDGHNLTVIANDFVPIVIQTPESFLTSLIHSSNRTPRKLLHSELGNDQISWSRQMLGTMDRPSGCVPISQLHAPKPINQTPWQ